MRSHVERRGTRAPEHRDVHANPRVFIVPVAAYRGLTPPTERIRH
jgi:hypothetical protein